MGCLLLLRIIRDDLRGLDKLGNQFVVFLGYRV